MNVIAIKKGDPQFDYLNENVHKCTVTGCWWWKGTKDENGFGIVLVDNTHHGFVSRYLWNLHNPEKRMGMKSYPFMVCMNMKCINPAHMLEHQPKRK